MCSFDQLTVIVPALNEEANISRLLVDLRKELPDVSVVVVDNGSTDRTAAAALAEGARLVSCEKRGKGAAIKAGIGDASTTDVFLCDADIQGLTRAHVDALLALRYKHECPAARLNLTRAPESAPVTLLTAKPLLKALGYVVGEEPLGGMILCERKWLASIDLPDNWAFEIALTYAAIVRGQSIVELPVKGVTHRTRRLVEYEQMAEQIAEYLIAAACSREL